MNESFGSNLADLLRSHQTWNWVIVITLGSFGGLLLHSLLVRPFFKTND